MSKDVHDNTTCNVPEDSASKTEDGESLLDKPTTSCNGCSADVLDGSVKKKKGWKSFSVLRYRYMMAAALSGGFFAMGMSLTSFGLTLPTLAENLKLKIDDTSPALIVRGFGFLLGSFTCGLLEKVFSTYVFFISYLVILSVGMFFIPFLNTVSLYIFVGVSSFGMGGYATAASVLALQLWGAKAETIIQILHLWYWLGCAFTPLVMEPFLNNAMELDKINSSNGNSNTSNIAFRNVTFIQGTSLPYVGFPYFCISGLCIAVVVFTLIFIPCSFKNTSSSQQKDTISIEGRCFRVSMLASLFLYFFFNVGLEVSIVTFLYSFGLSAAPGMQMTKDSSAQLSSVLLFSIVAGQVFVIFVSKTISPTVILLVDIIGVMASSVLLLLLPVYASVAIALFWVAVGVLGFFLANTYATAFVWAERYITVNARAASIFIIGASLGEMTLPIPVGLLIETSPMTFLYFIGIYVAAFAIIFVAMSKFALTKGRRTNRKDSTNEENDAV